MNYHKPNTEFFSDVKHLTKTKYSNAFNIIHTANEVQKKKFYDLIHQYRKIYLLKFQTQSRLKCSAA